MTGVDLGNEMLDQWEGEEAFGPGDYCQLGVSAVA